MTHTGVVIYILFIRHIRIFTGTSEVDVLAGTGRGCASLTKLRPLKAKIDLRGLQDDLHFKHL